MIRLTLCPPLKNTYYMNMQTSSKGVGTLPGGPYHIKLNDSYKPVQHPPRSVPLGMQSAYEAKLDRLMK